MADAAAPPAASGLKKGFFGDAKPPNRDPTAAYFKCVVTGLEQPQVEVGVRQKDFHRSLYAMVFTPFFRKFYRELDSGVVAMGAIEMTLSDFEEIKIGEEARWATTAETLPEVNIHNRR